jgi:hypothetical protein
VAMRASGIACSFSGMLDFLSNVIYSGNVTYLSKVISLNNFSIPMSTD